MIDYKDINELSQRIAKVITIALFSGFLVWLISPFFDQGFWPTARICLACATSVAIFDSYQKWYVVNNKAKKV